VKPFDGNYFIGYVNHVNPQFVRVHFPSSTLLNQFIFSGEEFNGGLVGNFVTIEGENTGFIGKISELSLPEKERLALSEKAFQSSDFHPTAKVEVLLSFSYFDSGKVERTLNTFPNIGAKVYVCSSEFIQQYVMQFGAKDTAEELLLSVGCLTSNKKTEVKVSQQALFGRHCAVVGTTGGGKSWTIARLIEGMTANRTKSILVDPTGEYKDLSNALHGQSVAMGVDGYFPYQKLTVKDLFLLVKPSERVQAPKLLEAIRSLKCIKSGIATDGSFSFSSFCESGNLIKEGLNKLAFERYCYRNARTIESDDLDFDISKLEKQINLECVWDTTNKVKDAYGEKNATDLSYCISLITRIAGLRRTGVLNALFGFGDTHSEKSSLIDIIEKFLDPKQKESFFLRIGFERVSFESQAREITANAIGSYLLNKARAGEFKRLPIVLLIDEAHQFLNKSVVDPYFSSTALESFDQIAKECRKYGLFLCIATQMPRDIPLGTLSQMGTFIVHRLINYGDKESIKQACSSMNSDLLTFLPVLGSGEAILTGVEFPMPLSVKVAPPMIRPDSSTPPFRDVTTYIITNPYGN